MNYSESRVVHHKRGGYCHELNMLLRMALNFYGFDVRPLLGRVHITGTVTGRGHQISLVTLENQQWILDVGFGAETPDTPLPLIFDKEIKTKRHIFKFVEDDIYGIMLKVKEENTWKSMYSFDLCHVCNADIDYGNHFASTHPQSVFVFARVAALPIEQGMITLFNTTLKKTVNNETQTIQLKEDDTYIEEIEKHFGIKLDASYKDFKPIDLLSLE